MKANWTLLIALVWTLFLAPSACLSGVFDHFCPCCPEVSCGHEVECSTDPCNLILVPVSQVRSSDVSLLDADISVDLPDFSDGDIVGWVASPVTLVIVPDTPTLPLPEAALPLVC